MNNDREAPARASAFDTIIYGGLAVGVLDMLDAFAFFGWYVGIGPQRVFQGVAAGVLGTEAARQGGWNSFWLGLLFHYLVAVCVASVYYIATRVLPAMLTHPVLFGLGFGVITHFVMQCVVIPFTAIGRWPTFPLLSTLNGIIGHALLVGLPVALIASWSARRNCLQ
jgi:hypothetical protein